jgi:preprotein translocase subunit YajC
MMHKLSALLAVFSPAAVMAQAADAPAAAPMAAGSPFASLLPLLLIFAVFYFVLIKPQQRRMKEHQATLAALKKGDKVVTGGGIIGKITKVAGDGDTVNVEIASGVEVTVLKSTVSGLVGAPVVAAEKKKAGNEKNDNTVPSRDNVANDN